MSLGKKMDLQKNCGNETAALDSLLSQVSSLQSYQFAWIKKESII